MKYVFASPGWLAAIHGIIVERAAREVAAKPKLWMSICEVFTNAPAGLSTNGRIAWSCVVSGTDVDFRTEERDDVLYKVIADYGAILPLGRYDTMGDPGRAEQIAAMAAALQADGRMRIVGARNRDDQSLSSVHDAIARLTT